MHQNNTTGKAALALAERGWPVFPVWWAQDGGCGCGNIDCDSPGKHPIGRAAPRGLKSATSDPQVIRDCWKQWPAANIGLRTGRDLWALDVDGAQGIVDFDLLCAAQPALPPAPIARTGGGGKHLLFVADDRIKCQSKLGGRAIDCRGRGGYIIVAPSTHASGNSYAWEISPDDQPLAVAPEWLIAFATGGNGKAKAKPEAGPTFVMEEDHDLATHPGTSKGDRNDMLCRLAGAYLAEGRPESDLQEHAEAWAERCDPPYPKADAAKTVSALIAKEKESTAPPPYLSTSFFAQLWPEKIDDVALHGIAGEIVELVAPHTEASREAVLVQLLAAFGSIVGRSAFVQTEKDRHFANLFVTITGDTSKGRKGTSWGWVKAVLRNQEQWLTDCVASGLSSGEGVIWAVRDPIIQTKAVKQKGVIVGYQDEITDQGVEDKRLLIVEFELANVLRVLQREGNTLSPILRQSWDNGNLRSLTKNSPARATHAHISVVAHVTRVELQRLLKADRSGLRLRQQVPLDMLETVESPPVRRIASGL